LWKIEIWKNDKNDRPGHWFINKIDVRLKLVPDSPGKNNKLKVADIKRSYESKREISLSEGEMKTETNNDKTKVSVSKSSYFSKSQSSRKLEGGFELKKSSDETRRVHWIFPCYRWIDEHEELFEGTCTFHRVTCLTLSKPFYLNTKQSKSVLLKEKMKQKRKKESINGSLQTAFHSIFGAPLKPFQCVYKKDIVLESLSQGCSLIGWYNLSIDSPIQYPSYNYTSCIHNS
jgi:hypothetical protein